LETRDRIDRCPLGDRLLVLAVESESTIIENKTSYGLVIASILIILWTGSLFTFLGLNLVKVPIGFIPIAVIWQTFLYTGLFITAHDAMHGTVFRQNKKINHGIGTLAVWLYGFLSYKELLKKHWFHHHHPASELDPDYHDGTKNNGISWYLHFMKKYWSWGQFNGRTVAFILAIYVLHISMTNLFLFWIIPPFLSSIQLFYFGTFLPHREPKDGYVRPHCAQTISLPTFWSFVTCYHFGYHEEHHEYPNVPWWKLPSVYQSRKSF
jgi:beta-carotene/zeaxanthin 4-ketolase